nr:U31_MYRTX_Sd1a [Stenamma debile]
MMRLSHLSLAFAVIFVLAIMNAKAFPLAESAEAGDDDNDDGADPFAAIVKVLANIALEAANKMGPRIAEKLVEKLQ